MPIHTPLNDWVEQQATDALKKQAARKRLLGDTVVPSGPKRPQKTIPREYPRVEVKPVPLALVGQTAKATGESAVNALYGVGAGVANTLRARFAQTEQNKAEMMEIFNRHTGAQGEYIAQARARQQALEEQIKASNANLIARSQGWNEKYAALPAAAKWTANAVGQTAQMVPAVAAGMIGGPGAASAVLGTQVHGNSVGHALGEGATFDQATRYGQLEALKEIAVERMFGFMPGFGKGMVNVDHVLANASRPVQIAGRTALGTLGEGIEEGVAQIATPFLQRATYAPEAPNATLGEVLDATGQGMVGGFLLGGAGNLYNSRLSARAAEAPAGETEAPRPEITRADNGSFAPRPQATAQQAAYGGARGEVGQFAPRPVQGQATAQQAAPRPELHIDRRDIETVRENGVRAFQYDHPSVKPYFQEQAQALLGDLQSGVRGQRFMQRGEDGEMVGVTGQPRANSEPIVRMLDAGMSYGEIERGLQGIIQDNGRENIKSAKLVEMYLDEAMSNGYQSMDGAVPINYEYLDAKSRIAGATPNALYRDAETIAGVQQEAMHQQTTRPNAGQAEAQQARHIQPGPAITEVDPATLDARSVRYISRAAAKAGLKYRVVDGLNDAVSAYIEGDTIVYNARTLDSPQKVWQVTAHEVYHSLLGTDEHSRLMDMAVAYYGAGRISVEQLIAAKKAEYAEAGVTLDDHAALDEIGADFVEVALADERTANRILTEQPNLAQRILAYIRSRLADFKAMRGMSEADKRQYAMLRQAQSLYEQGLKAQGREGAGQRRYEIVDGIGKDGKTRSYVRADRQVISGDNPKAWGEQVKRYINEKIRHGQDVYLMADNGDVLAITENTAGKAAFRNKVKNRQQFARSMNDNEYRAKLNAESHIDELAVTSIPDSWNEDVGNKHEKRGMADQGWDYRAAYFEDFDGSFYEIKMSVSRNGDIKEIYNIGRLNKRKNTVSTSGSSVRKDGARASILPHGRFDNTEDIGVSDLSIAEDAPLSNGLFENLTPEQQAKLLGGGENRRYKLQSNYSLQNDTTAKQRSHLAELLRAGDMERAGQYRQEIGMSLIRYAKFRESILPGYSKQQEEARKQRAQERQKNQPIQPEAQPHAQEQAQEASDPHKARQLAIVQQYNPMLDDYHTGIRSAEDIMTFEEAFNDGVISTPDYTEDAAQDALRTGKIRVYSSYPIAQGVFITPSKMVAKGYAGGGKVYSKVVSLDQVAWIDSLEGQFADVSGDSRYSLTRAEGQKSRFEQLLEEYGAMPPGEAPRTASDARTPQRTDPFNRVNRFTRTAMEAENVGDDVRRSIRDDLASDIASSRFVYEPINNKSTLQRADQRLQAAGYEQAVQAFQGLYSSGKRLDATDIALGERLIVEATRRGDTQTATALIADVAALGTEMGQAVQALRLIKRMTPEGRLLMLERTVNRINGKLIEERRPQVALNPRFAEEMLRQETVEGMDQVQTDALLDIAEQMPSTLADKINAWRYLSMLGNPRTHIRNIVGNAVFTPVRAVKNILSFTAEQFLPASQERTKSLHIRPEYRQFAKADYEQAKAAISTGGSKYDVFSQIEQQKRIFRNPLVEKMRKWNENALEAEDMFFSRRAYVQALAGYMQANHLTPDYLQSGTRRSGADFQRAQNYAVREAQKATFRDYSAMASALNQFERKNAATRIIGGAVMPFKKTPINILKRGVEYSPVGLADGLSRGIYQVVKKKITPAELIDRITAGVTGSGIMALGYFLASLGLLSAGEDDPQKKAAYDRALGAQNYAVDFGAVNRVFHLNLPEGTYTIDWMAPAVMPLMTGVELYNALTTEYGEDVAPVGQVVTQLTKVINPVLETSMMQGLLDVMQSFQRGSGGQLVDMAGSIATGYAGQFVPTAAGQVARTLDGTKRSTYAPTNSPITPTAERFVRQMMAKTPGASQKLEPQVDVWGREVAQAGGSMAGRAFNNLLNPGLYRPNTETAVDRQLLAMYDKTGESKVLPTGIGKAVEYGGKRYPLKASEYTTMQKQVGSSRYRDVQKLQGSVYTKELDEGQISNVIANLYEYRAKDAKAEYLHDRGITYEDSSYWQAKEAEAAGVSPVDYFAVKQIFGGKYEDAKKKYDTCKQLELDFDVYQRVTKELSDIRADKNRKGKAITNSRKNKVIAYLNQSGLTYEQKRYFLLQEYPSLAK